MRYSSFLIVLCCLLFIVVGCPQAKNDDLAVKTTTDYGKEAARRVEESGGCKYSEADYTNSDYGFSFKYPSNWSIPVDLQSDKTAVIAVRTAVAGDFTANFTVGIEKADSDLLKARKSLYQSAYQSYMTNLKILTFEHGKLNNLDTVFLHNQGVIKEVPTEQIQYFFNNRDKLYVLTSSYSPENAEQVQKELDAILATFKIGP